VTWSNVRGRAARRNAQFSEGLFDGIEIGTVGRQEAKLRAGSFDGDADGRLVVDGEVIEHHHIAGSQRRHQDLLDVGDEAGRVDGPIEDRRRRHPVGAQGGDHGMRLPMPARGVIVQPGAAWTPPIAAEEIGGYPTLIEKDVLPRVSDRQPCPPVAPLSGDVGPPLLVGVYGFF